MKLCEAFDCGVIIRKGGNFQFIDSKRLPPVILTPDVHTQLLATQLRELGWETGEVTYGSIVNHLLLPDSDLTEMGYDRNVEGRKDRGNHEMFLFPDAYQLLLVVPGGPFCQTYSSELALAIQKSFKDCTVDTLDVIDSLSLNTPLKTRIQLIFENKSEVYNLQQQIILYLLSDWEKHPNQSLYEFNRKLYEAMSQSMSDLRVIDFSAQSILPESKSH